MARNIKVMDIVERENVTFIHNLFFCAMMRDLMLCNDA